MPHPRRNATVEDLGAACRAAFTAPPAPPLRGEEQSSTLGLEVEWPVRVRGAPEQRVGASALAALDGTVLPAGGRLSWEPGGQVELSSAPARDVAELLGAVGSDVLALDDLLARSDLERRPACVDPRPARRVLDRPRYAAMQDFFDAQGTAGVEMMTNTAGTQINVGHDADDPARRWRLLNLLGPLLVACFACSPGRDGRGRRWVSRRQEIWSRIDPCRTRPVPMHPEPAVAWREYALDADVFFVPDPGSGGASGTALPPGTTMRSWLREGHQVGWPTPEDLAYHLTTLFPPVRPKGWLELRCLDLLPDGIRDVAVLTVALVARADVGAEVEGRLENVWTPDPDAWDTAARTGLADPELRQAAQTLFDVVGDQAGLVSDDPGHAAALDEFRDRYVRRGRCPGDDVPPGHDAAAPPAVGG